jgi:hypothetical protein
MVLNEKTRQELNSICQKYSVISEPRAIVGLYKELEARGIIIPCWDCWAENRPHPFEIAGFPVENSNFILKKYRFDHYNRVEYNCYFS